MKYSELRRIIEGAGCCVKRHGSNHDIYYSPITKKMFSVGRHNTQEVPKGTLTSILKDAGVKI
jgi:predicted RNA binding protein YcfA (HicA-like mRNA interferase family)